MKLERLIFLTLNSILLTVSLFFYVNTNVNLASTFLFVIYGFLGLFYILYNEIRKIEYKKYMYSEAYYIFVIIVGTIFLYVNNKTTFFNDFNIYTYLSVGSFIILPICFYLLTLLKNKKNKDKNGPKFVAKN